MTAKLLALFFLLLLLAGCSEKQQERPWTDMGLDYTSEYDGPARGDDSDLYMKIEQPAGSTGGFHYLNAPTPPGKSGGVVFGCPAHSKEWKGTPWWLQVTLYEEDGTGLINQQRWSADCAQYWLHIGKDGAMTLQPGRSPDIPMERHGVPGLDAWALVAGIVLSTLVAISRGRLRQH
ncbi:MAG: hypothetical protein LC623_04670 [Halobacteriales archaeon]|nr:hypothetical protein [Halobacteriales archaeon]